MVSTTVEQLGLVTIWPFHPRRRCWMGTSFRWSGLISGTSSGTSFSMRWFLELETTTWPAWANARSISVATDASMAENNSRGALPGLDSSTVRPAIAAGAAPSRCQLVASRYFLPAERSLAPSQVRSNQGWPCRNFTKCWPTMPVAPRMPTSIFRSIYSKFRPIFGDGVLNPRFHALREIGIEYSVPKEVVSPFFDKFRRLRRVAASGRAPRAVWAT